MKEFYFFSEKKFQTIIKEIFIGFQINFVSIDNIKKDNLINQNILLIANIDILIDLKDSFFSNNNVVVICPSNKYFSKSFFANTKVFDKHININKFIDDVSTYFVKNSLNYEDIEIIGERIVNKKTKKETFLTALEKDILILLVDQKQAEKNFLLENVLKIKKDTETKTIESHLTRIRNKLLKINSNLKIISKDHKVFLIP
tara:strand:- start:137 stop:739 length:603 start_codon:yes stop_codon:yes gene_type:complete